ncbi:ketol-acid reductoisomerase [Alicyclobacillus shizuokensis]|uniref:ketol-acid reductoisomerase n=1 Tax=Alicyclobacillus shizuokensis TaxID=392014 RepID=UPI000834F891|nr:ketol-acid reductoisomerase [Alicyclobacillus shizuokensis]
MRKVFYEKDASLEVLADKTIAVLGYGNQGRAQSLNMRDSGVQNIIIGNIRDASWERAEGDGFPVMSVREACARADIIFVLVPDEEQPQVYKEAIAPELRAGKVVNFASGYNVSYGLIQPDKSVDVTMVAPRMIGDGVRSLFVQGKGFPAFLDVYQDASGRAWEFAKAVALAIGALRTGSMAVTFQEETWMDLLTEQAILPLIYKVLEAAFEVQVEAGLPPEAVLLEMYMSKEPAEIFYRAAANGLFEQIRLHSQTSQYGQLTSLPGVDPGPLRSFIFDTLRNRIQSGAFARNWEDERQAGLNRFHRMREALLTEHPMATYERALREALGEDFL